MGADFSEVREERKVVSVLFCDLVGWTSTVDSADPEDVSDGLRKYHAAAAREIERHGGLVEKFIGDAVVGVWGVPAVREDDAERAVRAGLAIVEAVDADVRVAVNTGEALVRMASSQVQMGAGLVGDVVNVAARLQAFAPAGGVVVGERTHLASEAAVDYRDLGTVEVRGKRSGVRLWHAAGVRENRRSRPAARGPFVGRRGELNMLRDLAARCLEASEPQLVTVAGQPGVGKSRVLLELIADLDADQSPFAVLRGACPSYGDGIGFAALSEIVRARLGVRQTDSMAMTGTKLDAGVDHFSEAPWIRAKLAPLLGLPGEGGDRDEVFSAWRAFLEESASRVPVALVIEDLHWADDGMLAFVEHLAGWSAGVPLLMLVTTRPELFETHSTWGGGLTNATTITLRPLPPDETRELARTLLVAGDSRDDIAAEVAARSGGNPLWAEEFARAHAEGASASVPDSIEALIAARIDTLPASRKSLLHDASIIGAAFSTYAVAALSDCSPRELQMDLHELGRKELIRKARSSSLEGDAEHMFWHDLVRQVAYSQIPRRERAKKHRLAAEWLAKSSGDRVMDRAEEIARHYSDAFALATASGAEEAESLRGFAVSSLTLAGERALGLDRDHAERIFIDALEMSAEADPERARILLGLAECLFERGSQDEARSLLEQGRRLAERRGDVDALADILSQAVLLEWLAGDGTAARDLADQALERLVPERPTRGLARTLAVSAFFAQLQGDFTAAVELGTRGLDIAIDLHDDFGAGLASMFRGGTLDAAGERPGDEDLQRALELLHRAGSPMVAMAHNTIADGQLLREGPKEALVSFDRASEQASRIHVETWAKWARGESTWALFEMGDWDELLRRTAEVLAWDLSQSATQLSLLVAPLEARVIALRGNLCEARQRLEDVVPAARRTGDVQMIAPALTSLALVEYLDGAPDRARSALEELAAGEVVNPWAGTGEICRLLICSGARERAREIVNQIDGGPRRTRLKCALVRAMLAESDDPGNAVALYRDSAREWAAWPNPLEQARALAGVARCLPRLGLFDEATAAATQAQQILRRLGVAHAARAVDIGGQ